MLIMVFAVQLGWLPSNGRGATVDAARHAGDRFLTLDGLRAPAAAGAEPRAVQHRAGDPPDARRRARGAAAGLREVRARQGPDARAA